MAYITNYFKGNTKKPTIKYKMKNNSEIRFKCTTEQKEKIKRKAESCGMTIKGFLLYLGLNSTPKVTLGD